MEEGVRKLEHHKRDLKIYIETYLSFELGAVVKLKINN